MAVIISFANQKACDKWSSLPLQISEASWGQIRDEPGKFRDDPNGRRFR